MALDLSHAEVENLLRGFLTGALGVELLARVDLSVLPRACRTHVQRAEESGSAWTAWSTPSGSIAAWGTVDLQGSRRINAILLKLEWWHTQTGHHCLWAYCDPQRPTEWTVGRGRP